MTDRVDRALKALREFETGANPRAQETLDRVLRSASVSPRARSKAALWLPIAAVLAISTVALAQPGMRETIRGFLSRQRRPLQSVQIIGGRLAGEVRPIPMAPTHAASVETETSSVAATERSDLESTTVPPSTVQVSPRSVRSPTSAPIPERVATTRSSEPAPSAKETANIAPLPGVLSEEDIYERAHRLHFEDRSPSASIAAWDEYLGRFPAGRFVPEARYNRAIDLLKLQRYVEAREALVPFANGAYGDYHREAARDLLRTIP